MTCSVIGLGKIPLFEITANYFFVNGLNNNELAQEVMKVGGARNLRFSNSRGTQGPQFEDILFDYGPETKKLVECVTAIAETFNCVIDGEVWAQVHHPYESCNLHAHNLAHVEKGFVYYVQVPTGAGNLYFHLDELGVSVVQPVEGMCVVFPAQIKHGVEKNLSSNMRISIAGNFTRKP